MAWRAGPSGDARLSGAVLFSLRSSALHPSRLAVATGLKSVMGLDPSSGAVLWTVDRAQGALIPPAVDPAEGSHGVIVFTEGSGTKAAVTAIDASTRARLWRVPLTAAALGPPSIAGGHVFLGTSDGLVYSLDAKTGSLAWKVKAEGAIRSAPAFGDGKVFAVGEDDSSNRARLYAIDATLGRTAWSYSPGRFGVFASSPSVIPGTVFAGFSDHSVVALDTGSGALRWKQPVRGDFSSTSAPAYSNGKLFVADQEGGLYRFDAKSGKRGWDYQFSDFSVAGAPVVVGGMVFQGLDGGTISAVSASTGRLRWQTRSRLGPIGPFTPAGDLLLVAVQGSGGGIVAFRHDPAGTLVDQPSPSSFRPAVALRNFGAAFALMFLLILGFFRFLLGPRLRRERGEGESVRGEDVKA